MSVDHKKISKFLSYVLRHRPDEIGLALDTNGWAAIDDLIARAESSASVTLTPELLQEVVRTNDKQRFAISDDGTRIRASQGHSVEVDLALAPTQPPEVLFHGTATRFLDAIRRDGLKPMNRQHVHLSADDATATTVGQRHGKPVVLRVRAGDMWRGGRAFFISANGVWLTDRVEPTFLAFDT